MPVHRLQSQHCCSNGDVPVVLPFFVRCPMKSLLLDGMLWRLLWVAVLLALIWLIYFAVV